MTDDTFRSTSPAAGDPADRAARPRVRRTFYVIYGSFLLALLVAGFGRTFFFAPFFQPEPEHPVVYAHGVTLTAWFAVFLVQALLVAGGRRDLHRRLGIAAASIVVASAVAFVWMALHLFLEPTPIGTDAAAFERFRSIRLLRELTVFAAFPALAGLGLLLRRRIEAHKRLMMLATISLTGPAVGRLLQLFPELPTAPATVAFMAALVFAPVVHEWVTRGRVHPALAWGAPLYYVWLVGSGIVVPLLLR